MYCTIFVRVVRLVRPVWDMLLLSFVYWFVVPFLFGCTLIAAVIIYIVGRILIYLQANSERNDIRKQLKRLHRIEGSMKLYNL